MRLEDKEAIAALHWRGVPDEEGAQAAIERSPRRPRRPASRPTGAARCSRSARPYASTRAPASSRLLRDTELTAAVYVGDDMTDLDAFHGLDELVEIRPARARRPGRRAPPTRTPPALADEADVMVEGTDGVRDSCVRCSPSDGALRRLPQGDGPPERGGGDAARRRSRCSASQDFEPDAIYFSVGWWAVAALIGVWLGRRAEATPPIARLLATARTATTLPELHPGLTLVNRLWPLLL